MLTGPAYTVALPRGPILDPGRLDPLAIATSAVIARELRIRLKPRNVWPTVPVWMVCGPPECDCEICMVLGDEPVYVADERFEPLTEERQ